MGRVIAGGFLQKRRDLQRYDGPRQILSTSRGAARAFHIPAWDITLLGRVVPERVSAECHVGPKARLASTEAASFVAYGKSRTFSVIGPDRLDGNLSSIRDTVGDFAPVPYRVAILVIRLMLRILDALVPGVATGLAALGHAIEKYTPLRLYFDHQNLGPGERFGIVGTLGQLGRIANKVPHPWVKYLGVDDCEEAYVPGHDRHRVREWAEGAHGSSRGSSLL